MNTLERHEQILRTLNEQGYVSVPRAAELTGASSATIRRDLAAFAKQGLARRVRGGIRLVESVGMTPFAMRQAQSFKSKEALAQRAVQLLKAGDVIFVDGGTTTFHLGACLPAIPLRVITNSVRLAHYLDEQNQRRAEWEVFLTGGLIYPNSGLLLGPAAQASVTQYHAHWAFLSVGGITLDGLYNTTELVVETERLMIAHADQVVVLADSSKLGKHAMCQVCRLSEVDYLVTNRNDAQTPLLRQFEQAGLQIVVTG
ncbi:MAG: DeoR/GlpR family DNA-binding transcription regulator [Verrucomicrobiota bacterium]